MIKYLGTLTFVTLLLAKTLGWAQSKQPALTTLCQQFNVLNTTIRDSKISKPEALQQLRILLTAIQKAYTASVTTSTVHRCMCFPLKSYNWHAIGGVNGSGYISSGYSYFSGNKHGGHPAHDIFITDKNQDCIDDKYGNKIDVLSTVDGVVVAVERLWKQGSEQRGGNYIWIYSPTANRLIYYAHNADVFVNTGDIVKCGDRIATVGRSGMNASKKRSPTHLHYMVLQLNEQYNPLPVNTYTDLKKTTP